jgi:hypothetical protein
VLGETPSTTQLRMARLSTLLAWHRRFPATEAERRRNHRVDTLYQGNRNPFVDHPYYADLVFASAAAPTPRAAWRLHRFSATQLADSAISAELADPDRDAMTNLLEYALGTDPLRPDPAPLRLLARLPPLSAGTGERFRLSHRRHRFADDLVYTYQVAIASALAAGGGSWANATATVVSSTRSADNLYDTQVVEVTAPPTANFAFVRLQVRVKP